MKLKLFSLFIIFFTSISWYENSDIMKTLEIGTEMPSPEYKMMDISDKKVSLSEVKKKNGLLVIFSCNTCPYVLAWEDRYPIIAKECAEKNIGLILVNSNEAKRNGDDSFNEMKKHAKEYNYNFYYTVDKNSVLANKFGATRTPHTFLFNSDNMLVYQGGIDDNHNDAKSVKKPYLMDAIQAVSINKVVKNNILRSPGCSIKRL